MIDLPDKGGENKKNGKFSKFRLNFVKVTCILENRQKRLSSTLCWKAMADVKTFKKVESAAWQSWKCVLYYVTVYFAGVDSGKMNEVLIKLEKS